MADAIADTVDVIGRAKRGVVDLQDVSAVIRDPDGVEAEARERGRGTAADVELDDRSLDGRAIAQLDDMLAALSRARLDTLRARVLAHVHSIGTKRLRE